MNVVNSASDKIAQDTLSAQYVPARLRNSRGGQPTSRADLDRPVVPQIGFDVQDFLSGLPARYRQLPDQISDVLTRARTIPAPL